MIWALAAAAAAFLFFAFANRPSRRVITLSSAAHNASLKQDWAASTRFLRLARETAGRLQEPLKTAMTAVVDLQWGTLLYRQGKFEEAEGLLRQGLVKARASLVPGADVVMQGDATWGDLCTDCGRHGEAEQHYRRILAVDEQRGNIGGAIFDLQRVADCLIRQERRDDAEIELRRAMDMEASIVKGNPISMIQPDIHYCLEEYEQARRFYRGKVEMWERKAKVPEQIDLGRLQMRLALAEERTGHRAAAVEMYARAEATFERQCSPGHPRAAAAREARKVLSEQSMHA